VSSFCLGCGNSIAEGERYCAVCGRDSQAGTGIPAVDPQVAFGLPPETSGKAIFSLVCGILFVILPFSIIAVIFGYIALSEIRKSPGRLEGRGLAITGIVLGYVGVAVTVGFVGLGMYGFRKAQKEIKNTAFATSEGSVVSSMRTLNMAEIAYGQAHRNVGYTCSLAELQRVWGISRDLAGGKKNGYQFELQNCVPSRPGGPIAKYQLLAYSADPVRAGAPAYCTDESDIIRVVRNGSPHECFKRGTQWNAAGQKEINRSQTQPR
jgi:hypothetical protein